MDSEFWRRGHWDNSQKDTKNVKELIGKREVKSISPIRPNWCLESYPCQGHEGVKIIFNDGEMIEYKCPSVSIAFIQKSITGKVDPHFKEYIKEFTPKS